MYPACNACPYLQYFSTLCHKRHDFREKIMKRTMCVSIVSTDLSETFVILGTDRDIIKNVFRSSYEVPFILVRFK